MLSYLIFLKSRLLQLCDMEYQFNDGGRAAAGYKGTTGDCVVRAVAIATMQPYQEVYEKLSEGCRTQRKTKHSRTKASARNGVNTQRKWFKEYMEQLGWKWTPTMGIGTGCKVHLREDELPKGRLIVAVSRHYTTVIDGVIHDAFDPQRIDWIPEMDRENVRSSRCVYGYWSK